MSSFDPYRDWLGVDASGGPPNLYRLLGLREFESEPPVIAEALDEQTAKLQSRLSGPGAAVAQQLLAQLQKARETLLHPERRQAYDAQLRGEPAPAAAPPATKPTAAPAHPSAAHPAPHAAMPPVAAVGPPAAGIPTAVVAGGMPVAAAAIPGMPLAAGVPMAMPAGMAGGVAMAPGVPMAAVAAPGMPGMAMAATPVAPVAGGVPLAAPAGVGVPAAPGAVGGFSSRPSTGRVMLHRAARKSDQATMAVILVSGAVLLLLIALGFAFKDQLLVALGGKPAAGPTPGALNVPGEPPTPEAPEPPRRLPPRPMFGPGSPTLVDPNTLPPDELSRMVGGTRENQLGSMQSLDPVPGTTPTGEPSAGTAMPASTGSAPAATASPSGTAAAPAAATGGLAAIPASTAPVDPKSQSAVRRTLGVAQRFLGERNLDRANEQLDLAALEATHPALLVEIERLRRLVAATREFWIAAGEGAKSLQAGEEFELEGRKVQIIESDGQKIEARVNNQGLTYQLDKLPGPLAIFLVQRSTAGDEARQKHLLGAFLLSEPKPDRARARQLLAEAAQLGADCQPLVDLIDASEPAGS